LERTLPATLSHTPKKMIRLRYVSGQLALNSNERTTEADFEQSGYGAGVPATFKGWLTDPDTGKIRRDKYTRVAFGADDSFFAWDRNSVRWSNVGKELEEKIQEWLSPSGWIFGPPKIVALGVGKAYFMISEYGAWSYWGIPLEMANWIKKKHRVSTGSNIEVSHLESVSLIRDGND
jgi:hypothetical protein